MDDLLLTPVRVPIPPSLLSPLLSVPPFLPPPFLNARDIGLLPESRIRPALILRSAALDHSPLTRDFLASTARVTRIFDLRRAAERAAAPDPQIPGATNVWLPTALDYPEPELQRFTEGDGSEAWGVQYLSVAEAYAPTYRAVLEHVRDRPGEPLLFHCTAGRDRTGVLAGLLHHLAATPAPVALTDYMLSRLGTEPAREKLIAFATMTTGAAGFDTPGFENLVDLRPAYWTAFLQRLEDKFGGWDGYATSVLGLSEEDLETIRRNIRRPEC